jgi:hemerythrin-like domain-containing protein
MLAEHDQGRAHVAVLAELAGRAAWDGAERETLCEAAIGYGTLLRAHIQKEDRILYPMALQRLPAPLQARVDEACAAFDAKRTADGSQARLVELGQGLAARHLLAVDAA